MSATLVPVELEELLRDGCFTIGKAQEFSGLSRSTLYAFMETGQLEYTKCGKRRLIPRRTLTEFLGRGLVARQPMTA